MVTSDFQFDRCGGHLALDFANTLGDRHSARPAEHLPDYAALLEFARQTQALPAATLRRLGATAGERPARAAEVTVRARRLREALYWMFVRVAGDGPALEDGELAAINAEVARLRLDPDGRWTFALDPDGLDEPIGAVVLATRELLEQARDRVHTCASPTCRWVFLDTSKNRSRRWCEMKSCGNRMKQRRHRART